jgi:hypothetical protein
MENSNGFQKKDRREIANQGLRLKEQRPEMMFEDLRKQGKRKEVLYSSRSI